MLAFNLLFLSSSPDDMIHNCYILFVLQLMELKMKAFKISLIYFCFVLASCADKANLEQNSLFTIKASFSKEMKLNLSDFAESIEFIPLETDDDCLI